MNVHSRLLPSSILTAREYSDLAEALRTRGGSMRSFKVVNLLLMCLMITGLVHAQGVGSSGDIRGTVTDPSGAIVAGASVTATDIAKGIKRTVTTDSNGEYRFPGVAPAVYSISVTKSGFQ